MNGSLKEYDVVILPGKLQDLGVSASIEVDRAPRQLPRKLLLQADELWVDCLKNRLPFPSSLGNWLGGNLSILSTEVKERMMRSMTLKMLIKVR